MDISFRKNSEASKASKASKNPNWKVIFDCLFDNFALWKKLRWSMVKVHFILNTQTETQMLNRNLT